MNKPPIGTTMSKQTASGYSRTIPASSQVVDGNKIIETAGSVVIPSDIKLALSFRATIGCTTFSDGTALLKGRHMAKKRARADLNIMCLCE